MSELETYPCCGVERAHEDGHADYCPQKNQAEALDRIADALENLQLQVSKP